MRQKILTKTATLSAALILGLSILAMLGRAGEPTHQVDDAHHGFGDVSLWAQILEGSERDQWQKPEEVIKNLNLKPGDVIADIGAGTGYFTRRFALAVGPQGKALGLEIEPSMVEHIKQDARRLNLGNYEARLVKPDDPGLEPRSVDVIFSPTHTTI